ncbi:hypothetical protein DQ384_36540 [Sphaerisporangium album]|uniref:Uncharacterized protein n=1 Tax=Sphaerisporangium album TaxID=509200 RepID=A0A367EUP9_9ACTN|nr:hypothetical protein DQ384_36540 [Sphaerisporangium album]
MHGDQITDPPTLHQQCIAHLLRFGRLSGEDPFTSIQHSVTYRIGLAATDEDERIRRDIVALEHFNREPARERRVGFPRRLAELSIEREQLLSAKQLCRTTGAGGAADHLGCDGSEPEITNHIAVSRLCRRVTMEHRLARVGRPGASQQGDHIARLHPDTADANPVTGLGLCGQVEQGCLCCGLGHRRPAHDELPHCAQPLRRGLLPPTILIDLPHDRLRNCQLSLQMPGIATPRRISLGLSKPSLFTSSRRLVLAAAASAHHCLLHPLKQRMTSRRS